MAIQDIVVMTSGMKPVISPTYRYFLRSKDSCVFLVYLQFWHFSGILNKSQPAGIPDFD
jgi:hypothetical protein